MTLRASKPAFNVREKLTELGRRFGLKGSELVAAETVQEARDLVSAGRKNYFINGSALVWQRGTSNISNSAYSGNYGCDRWWLANGATTVDRSTTVPSGFQYSMKYTSNGSASTIGQAIELTATGISQFEAGKEYTLSVWARTDSGESNLGFIVFYRNSKFNNTNQTNWNPYAPTVGKMTTEWKKFTYTFTAPTVNSNNTLLGTEFSFNKTAYFTGFQLEAGRNATDFEHRSYGEELALCQRYYQKIVNSSGNNSRTVMLGGYNTTRAFGGLPLSVPLRTNSPAFTHNNLALELINLSNTFAVTDIGRYGSMGDGGAFMGVEANAASGLTGGTIYYLTFQGTGSYLTIDAEL